MRTILGLTALLVGLLPAQVLEKTLLLPDSLGGVQGPGFVEYSPVSHRFFIGGVTGKTLIIDGLTLERVGHVEPDFGYGLTAYDPDRDRLYIVNNGVACVVDCESGHIVAQVPGFTGVRDVCLSRQTNKLYVGLAECVGVVDCDADTLLGYVHGWNHYVEAIAWDPEHDRVYGVDRLGLLQAIDCRTDTVVGTVEIPGTGPEGMALNEADGRLYVPFYWEDAVWVLDTDPLQLADSLPLGEHPLSVFWNPLARKLYVGARRQLWVYDGHADTVLVVHDVPYGCNRYALDSTDNKVYGLGGNGCLVIDGETNAVLDSLRVGGAMSTLHGAWNSDLNVVGLVDYYHSAFFSLDCATDTAVQVYEMGHLPRGAVYNPGSDQVWVYGGYETRTLPVVNASTLVTDTVLFTGLGEQRLCLNPTYNKVYGQGRYDFGIYSCDPPGIIRQMYSPLYRPYMVYNYVNDRLYVAGGGANTRLTVLDGETDEVISVSETDNAPRLAWNPLENHLYITGIRGGQGWFSVIDLDGDTTSALAKLQFDRELGDPLCDTIHNKVYLYAYILGEWDSLYVFEAGTLEVTKRLAMPREPVLADWGPLHWAPQVNKLYIPANDTMWVFSTTEDRFVGNIPYEHGTRPTHVVYCPANNRLLTNVWFPDGGGQTRDLAIINCETDRLEGYLEVGLNPLPRQSGWDPVHNRVFIPIKDESKLAVLRVTPSGFEVEDSPALSPRRPGGPTIVAGTLVLPAGAGYDKGAVLVNAAGQRVLGVRPGVNDLSGLPPGAYFLRVGAGTHSAVRKVLIAD